MRRLLLVAGLLALGGPGLAAPKVPVPLPVPIPVPTPAPASTTPAKAKAKTPAAPGKAGRKPATGKLSERAALERQLQSSERPPTAEELRAHGRQPDRLLVTIAEDARSEPLLRARAVSALGSAPTPTARLFLARTLSERLASKDATDRLLLRRAAVALGWQGGSSAAAEIAPLLDHEDPEVRIDAGVALGLCRLPAAIPLLRARVAKESDQRVRANLGRQLATLERALPASGHQGPGGPVTIPPSAGAGSRSAF